MGRTYALQIEEDTLYIVPRLRRIRSDEQFNGWVRTFCCELGDDIMRRERGRLRNELPGEGTQERMAETGEPADNT